MKRGEVWRRLGSIDWISSQALDALFHLHDSVSSNPFARVYKIVRPYTMTGNRRLRGLYTAIQQVTAHGIPGDIVECGTARGGSAALMGLALKEAGDDTDRSLWMFDTFEGIPPPTMADPDYDIAALYTGAFRAEVEDVEALFRRLGIMDRTKFVKGLFQHTVPRADVAAIAVLHVDGDWYESVKACLDGFYDRVSPGGVIQIDDYGHWEGARKAVDELIADRRIAASLRYIDYTGRQLVKP